MTEIKNENPPNFKSIANVFPGARGHGVIFAYAPYIYAPHHPNGIPAELVAHEEIHIARQSEIGVEKWWALYFTNTTFRFVEELLAHRAEYQHLGKMSRQVRRSALKVVAKKLAAPLYDYPYPVYHCEKLLAAPHIDGCFACYATGIADGAYDGPECGKCDGAGYLELEEAA